MPEKTQNEIVYIVNPASDVGSSPMPTDYTFPALAPLALGTWLKEFVPDSVSIVRDGNVVPQEQILAEIEAIKPGIVGVSVLGMSYKNCLEIARRARNNNSYVVFGGDHASQLSYAILQRRPYVDFVVGSDYGELPFEILVRSLIYDNEDYKHIPDIAYRDGTGSVAGYKHDKEQNILRLTDSPVYRERFGILHRKDSMDLFPIVDRRLYPGSYWQTYLKNYAAQFSQLHPGEQITGVTTMNRARGCSRAKNPCKFCDILNLDPQFSSPERFWAEVRTANEQIRANVFYEVCDSFSSFPDWINGIVTSRPNNLGFEPRFFIYAQAVDLVRHTETAAKLKEIGVFKVNMGLESGSDMTLKHLKGVRDSVAINYEALKRLKEAGIFVYGSFVLGSEVETPETLRETIAWIKQIVDEGLIADIEIQPVLPYVENYQGRKLEQHGLFSLDGENPDWPPNVNVLSMTYVNRFSGVTYDQVRDAVDEVIKYARGMGLRAGSADMVD